MATQPHKSYLEVVFTYLRMWSWFCGSTIPCHSNGSSLWNGKHEATCRYTTDPQVRQSVNDFNRFSMSSPCQLATRIMPNIPFPGHTIQCRHCSFTCPHNAEVSMGWAWNVPWLWDGNGCLCKVAQADWLRLKPNSNCFYLSRDSRRLTAIKQRKKNRKEN